MTPGTARGWLCLVGAAFVVRPALATAAASGQLGGGRDLGVSLSRIVTALLICIMVALLAALLIRQRSGKTDLHSLLGRLNLRPRAIEVVETRRLSQHADICLIRHGGREYLLLLMHGAARLLNEDGAVPPGKAA